MSSRFSISWVSRSSDSSAVSSSSWRASRATRSRSLRSEVTDALADASGLRRSWLTACEQRGPGAVGLGDDRGLGGPVGELLALVDDRGLRREGGQQPPVSGPHRTR